MRLYEELLALYGKQGWWPLFNPIKNKFEYYSGNPKNFKQKLEICLGAILTQNTNWNNAEKALLNLINKNLINIDKLDRIPENKLALLIKSSGYYKQKAKKIKEFIKFLKSNKEITRENLLKVWGVGKETADSILLYAYDKPYFVTDNYTKRFFSKLDYCKKDIGYDELQKLITSKIPKDINLYKEFHALIVKHSKINKDGLKQ